MADLFLSKRPRYIVNRVLILVLLGIIFSQAISTTAFGFVDEPGHTPDRVLVVLKPDQTLPAVIDAFKSVDAQISHQFPPDAFIASLSAPSNLDVVESLRLQIFTGPVDLAITQDWPGPARQAAIIWNTLQESSADQDESHHLHPLDAGSFGEPDAFEAPLVEDQNRMNSYDSTPSFYESSQFLIGSVAVGIVLPESTGQADPSSENWTADEKALVVSEIVSAMDWWANLEPGAQLSFVYDNIAGNTMPTSVEPITHPFADQHYWIRDTMSAMGFESDGSYLTSVRHYNDYLRQTYQTDWAFTVFVVDSSADSDNTFPDGHFAYAYLGGPFMVMTYGNQNYGPANMDAVAAHELGHIFRALDQYSGAEIGCSVVAGYLGVENQNSTHNCQSNQPSIMRGQVWPFSGHEVDHYARGQVGWRDVDDNGILDPIDVGLRLNDVTWSEAHQANILTFNVDMEEIPFESPGFRNILINKLQAVYYRVDEGPWLAASAGDGAFDSYREEVTFTTDPLSSGTHTIYGRTDDNFGKINEQVIATVTVTDPFEHIINTELSQSSSPKTPIPQGETLTLSGTASHATGHPITEVQFRIDGDSWLPAQPLDGAFDSSTEAFGILIDTAEVDAGSHYLQARSVDSQGMTEASTVLYNFSVQPLETENVVYLPVIFSSL